MQFRCNESYYGFRLIEKNNLTEIESLGYVFEHEKSGARLVIIQNEDEERAFSISFKTPPHDNTGVAHILEHAVCCASQKYPLKDVFMEFEKGSLCTSMNACTYSDMTMYYGSSLNEKDFKNLIEVFMDLVFYPLIHKDSHYFKQEGWHYEVNHLKEPLAYSGVVYHEMQSEYNDPATVLERGINEALFPNTPYFYDAGGIPEHIVTLNEEGFLAFYNEYYTASNCVIYLYGKINILEQLAFLNEICLKDLNKKERSFSIPLEEPFKMPKSQTLFYPMLEEQAEEEETWLGITYVIGTAENSELRLAFEILEHMLLKSAASPLAKALIEEGQLGKSIEEGGYDPSKRQPTFSIILRGTSEKNENLFRQKIIDTFRVMTQKGIDKELLQAAIHTIEFGLKEEDYSYESKGIIYSEMLHNSYLYGGKPFVHLTYKETLEKIKKEADNGYFEKLIETYFLDNNHQVLTLLKPSKALYKKQEEKQEEMLEKYRESLSKQQLSVLIKENKLRNKRQELKSENIGVLPKLKREDISEKVAHLTFREENVKGCKMIFEPYKTHGIAYIHLLLDTTCIKEEDIPYIGLLAHLLTYMSTENYSYNTLENLINRITGGINCSINTYEGEKGHKPYFKISSKVEIENLELFTKLMMEIMSKTIFTEQSKMKEMIESLHYELKRSFEGATEYRALKRLYTYFSWAGAYEDQVGGVHFYTFIKDILENFEECIEEVCKKLKEVYDALMSQDRLMFSVTSREEDYNLIKGYLQSLVSNLKSSHSMSYDYFLEPCIKNEAYLTGSALQTVAKGFNFKKLGYPFKGQLYVASMLLESTYLWEKIRLQGGAYGCEILLNRKGQLVVYSYADPHLIKTLQVFDNIGKFLRSIKLSEEELEQYIIGTIGAMDAPLTAEQISERSLSYYFEGVTTESLQKERMEILHMKASDLKKLAVYFDETMKANAFCVIGNKKVINDAQKLFKAIKIIL